MSDTTIVAKSDQHETAVRRLNKAINEVNTRLRKRKVPLSNVQTISIIGRLLLLMRRLMRDARYDTAKIAATDLQSLSRLVSYGDTARRMRNKK